MSDGRTSAARGASAKHTEQVLNVVEGHEAPPGLERISASWQRSATRYRIDPAIKAAPRIATSNEIKDLRGAIESLIAAAQIELDGLYKLVRPASYTVLLCDRMGVAVEHRGDDALASEFRHWGIWLGGVWSESAEGTNGIGTCIAEARPVTIHRGEHYRARHINLSCSGAPIFGVDGELAAVLDVSSYSRRLSEGAHALTGGLTMMAARAIGERLFRERYRREWILALTNGRDDGPSLLLAVDNAQRVVGANRAARNLLRIENARLRDGFSLWSLIERKSSLFRRNDGCDMPARVLLAHSGEELPALLTPPQSAIGGSSLHLHARPRADLLRTMRELAEEPQARAGLTPATMHRIHDYVESHLGENIDLPTLAGIADLSVFHFARQFKRSVGVTPHYYLMQKRIERAQQLLTGSELTLSEVALASGFSDQGHLARRFRQITGTTPSQFRQSR